jgi:SAM-dependent methyltransferase
MFAKLAGREKIPLLYAHWEPLIPPRELWVGPSDPLLHFLRWPLEYRAYLTILCLMRENARVLELGCNHGRTMLGLVDYLKPPGRYEGLDILKPEIHFAQMQIHAAYAHFNFTHAGIQNSFYNPEGRLRPETYQFPYEDAAFDIIYAASLFTHLLPPSLVNYFRESRRVLKRGGRCLFSGFLLDYYQGPETTQASVYEFDHPLSDGSSGESVAAVYNPDRPENLIAYKRAFVERIATDCGFKVARVLPSFWSKSQACAVNE